MILLMLFFCLNVFSASPAHWDYIVGIQDKHEFYQSGEDITKPENSWETLFSLVYLDRNFNHNKDCIFYKVPGVETGRLKFKTVGATESCEKYRFRPGDTEIADLKSLVFETGSKKLILNLTYTDFKTETIEAKIIGQFERPKLQQGISSAEFKSPKVIFLSPKSSRSGAKLELKDGSICHEVNDECEEKGASTCSQCENGFYEIPNGCMKGPKYCGSIKCGLKGNPACRRGYKFQREDIETFDCRVNSNFAYCAEGLSVFCEGKRAYCR